MSSGMDPDLRALIEVPGVAGQEERVRAWIAEHLPPAVSRETDAMGNLVASWGSGERGIPFVAHMDEIGFLVTEIRADGCLHLRPLGGIDPRTLIGREVRVVTASGEVPGVIPVTPPHLMQDRTKEMRAVPAANELVVDLGTRSEVETRSLGVDVLNFVVPRKTFTVLGENLWCARGLDDRAGCWVLLRALERLLPDPAPTGWRVDFVFSVQEEVGLRGAELLSRRRAFEYAFAVDSCSAGDGIPFRPDLASARLGAGAALRVADNASVIPADFVREVQDVAAASDISCQIGITGGGTDIRPLQETGARVMPLCIPMRYAHSSVETVDRRDLESLVNLVCALVRRYTG